MISQKKVREFLRHYNRERKITTILTSHYMQDIEELCERVLIIDHGKLFFDGPLESIVDRFASYKILNLTFSDASSTDLTEYGTVIEQSAGSVRLRVSKEKVTQVCRDLLERFTISDFGVGEVPIEDVIGEVFKEQSVK